MKLPIGWLRDFVDAPDDATAVASKLGACGFGVEEIDAHHGVVDFEITANRPDCMSVYGLAREASAAFHLPLKAAQPDPPARATGSASVKVSIGDAGCGRYALATADVTVGPSPEWLAARLSLAGVRPINNIVDVTNYVMLEPGHPMHAFDATTLGGSEIHVRRARANEKLTTLDGQARTLDETMLVIADRERAVAIAGVIGGAATEVTAATTRVAFESAWFRPASVRVTSRKLGLKTEASMRFERGADLAGPVAALERAMALLARIGAGQPTSAITDIFPRPAERHAVTLRRARIARLLGDAVPDQEVERILTHLGFTTAAAPDGWRVEVPTFRVDVSREADLIEEVGRHWGFDRIAARFPPLGAPPRTSDAAVTRARLVRRVLCGAGLQEAATFTFLEEAAVAPFAPAGDLVAIQNPLSEKFAALRPSLAPGLAESLGYNLNRQAADVRLFELGTVFSATRGERTCVGWVMAGARGQHWSEHASAIEFTDAKGVAELVASSLGVAIDTVPGGNDLPWLMAGQRARVEVAGGAHVGWIGRLAVARGLDVPVYAGEIDLDALAAAAPATRPAIEPLPRFPAVVRDLSIVVDEGLPAADVRGTIRSHAPAILTSIREFDRYQGKGVPAGRVSLSVRLTFRATDRTLTDTEVQRAADDIVAALGQAHGAVLR